MKTELQACSKKTLEKIWQWDLMHKRVYLGQANLIVLQGVSVLLATLNLVFKFYNGEV